MLDPQCEEREERRGQGAWELHFSISGREAWNIGLGAEKGAVILGGDFLDAEQGVSE